MLNLEREIQDLKLLARTNHLSALMLSGRCHQCGNWLRTGETQTETALEAFTTVSTKAGLQT
jgi:DNA-binding CsgD family transcriptional regulator